MLANRRTFMGGLALSLAATTLSRPAHADQAVAPLGEDGLHKPDWIHETFRDMRDDLEEAKSLGKRMLIMVEQRGCIYCTRMHEHVYIDDEISRMLREDFFVVQMNLFGNVPVTDFDGEERDERDMMNRWGVVFTPTVIFMPEANQGPLIGIFFTGPLGFVLGLVLGAIVGWVRRPPG